MWTAWYVSTQNKEIVRVYFWRVTLHDPWSILDFHFKASHPQIVLWMHSLLRISFSNEFMLGFLDFLALLSDRELKKIPSSSLRRLSLAWKMYATCLCWRRYSIFRKSIIYIFPAANKWDVGVCKFTACMIWVLFVWNLLFLEYCYLFIYFGTSLMYLSCTSYASITYQHFIFNYVTFFNITYMFRLYTKVWSKIPTSELLMQPYFTHSLRFRHLYFQTILMIHTLNSNHFLCEWLT
jgi:hypothetical protein